MKNTIMMNTKKVYSRLRTFPSFEDRFEYLKLGGVVGQATFGYDRYLNQMFYKSSEWKRIRDFVISRDFGCDLGIPGYEIHTELLVHHMNPINSDNIIHDREEILDPEFLITTTQTTHNAIHYGDRSLLTLPFVERRPGDTKLW